VLEASFIGFETTVLCLYALRIRFP